MVKSILAIVLSCAAGAIAQAPSADGQIVEVDLNAATSVTIHAASTKPADIAQQIAPDDIRFINPNARLDPVSLDAAGEPLLSALSKLCIATGASPVQRTPHEALIMLEPQGKSRSGRNSAQPSAGSLLSAPIAYSGPFAAILTELNSSQQLQVVKPEGEGGGDSNSSPTRNLSFSIALLAEPKVVIAAIVANADIEEADDPEGANYATPNRADQNVSWNGYQQPPLYQFTAQVNNVPRQTQKLALLKGSLRVRAVKKYMIHELIPAEGKSQDIPVNDLTCVLLPLERQGANQCRIRIKVPRAGQDDASWESFRQMMRWSRAIATDAAGNRLSEGWRGADESGDLTIHMIFNQPKSIGAPARIIWQAPLEYEEITIPFEFKDLPIPY